MSFHHSSYTLKLDHAEIKKTADLGLRTNSSSGGGRGLQRLRGRTEPALPVQRAVCTHTTTTKLAHANAQRLCAKFADFTTYIERTAATEQFGRRHQGYKRAVRALG